MNWWIFVSRFSWYFPAVYNNNSDHGCLWKRSQHPADAEKRLWFHEKLWYDPHLDEGKNCTVLYEVTGRSPATDGTSLCSGPFVPQRHTGLSWCPAACGHDPGGTAHKCKCTHFHIITQHPAHKQRLTNIQTLLHSAATHL